MGYEAKKTEHAGAKHGNGAYRGPKKAAKRGSNKARRRNAKQEIHEQVDALLLEGLHSGPATPMTDRDWQELRKLAGQRSARRHATKKTRAPSPPLTN